MSSFPPVIESKICAKEAEAHANAAIYSKSIAIYDSECQGQRAPAEVPLSWFVCQPIIANATTWLNTHNQKVTQGNVYIYSLSILDAPDATSIAISTFIDSIAFRASKKEAKEQLCSPAKQEFEGNLFSCCLHDNCIEPSLVFRTTQKCGIGYHAAKTRMWQQCWCFLVAFHILFPLGAYCLPRGP